MLPAVRAFDAIRHLTDAELEALWPLVVLRGAVLVVSGEHQVGVDAQNDYASAALDREWRMFTTAESVPTAVMTALIRDAVGRPAPARTTPTAQRILPAEPVPLDLSTTSPAADDGAWLVPGWADGVAASALAAGAAVVAAPARVARIGETRVLAAESSVTVPTGATLWIAAPTTLTAPWAGEARWVGAGRVELRTPSLRLVLLGVQARSADRENVVGAGEAIATAEPGVRVEVQLLTTDTDVPLLVRPELAPGWLALTTDPAPLLGLPVVAADPDPMPRRVAHLADVQEHYYAHPPRIERGWRVHLVDTDGRAYLDMVNNVASVGHAHPRIGAAVSRQLALLNTNSRFHYGAIADFADALSATLPDPLDTVFLVNSGSEATDLAIRLAQAATGRPDIVAVREAYHGWTSASDAVSTSIADNPNAPDSRPGWVHVVDAPNPYRGRHRDAEAMQYGPEAAAHIRTLAASGRPPAAFIAEPFFGNAGGVALPDGYLEHVYTAVREAGGLAIADEVQVGYGRLGAWFWGFEQQGVVPDVVAVAKSMGNGHPLGAVITSREIAARYRAGGYFFSSTGGSPVSSVVGLTVLDIIRAEGLQANARVVGAHLKAGLAALADRHPLIGAVHGSGLYLGVEFVRDRAARDPATAETAAICNRLLDLGVIMQPTGDFLNVLKIKPPLVLAAEQADFFVAQLDRVLTDGW